MKWGRFKSIPVITVLVTSCYIYYVTVFIFIDGLFGLNTSIGSINALFFTLLSSLTTLSLFVCVLTDPGRVPSGFVPDIEGSDQGILKPAQNKEPEVSLSDLIEPENSNRKYLRILEGQQTKCDKCSAYKPPRTHHCRSCRSCILRMDHHCSWVNNCIGHKNYKAFFVLVLYATAASLYSSVAVISSVLNKDWNLAGDIGFKLFYIASGVVIIGLTLTLGTLLGWHIYLIIHNMTTIEYYEGVRAAWLAKKSGQSYRHQFDVGIYKNITLVLGPNILKWPWPTASSHIKDGINFPTIRDN